MSRKGMLIMKDKKIELLSSTPIPKALLAMGIPAMLGMLVNALYNLADAYFVSALGESQMGAISVVFPIGQVWGLVKKYNKCHEEVLPKVMTPTPCAIHSAPI